jgi:ubiquitin-conjugating enzyme E2 M
MEETKPAETKQEDAPEASVFAVKKAHRRRKKKNTESEGTSTGKTAAHLRTERDRADLELPDNVELVRTSEDDFMNFSFIVRPDMGYWKGGEYEFEFKIPPKYPYDPPKVLCKDKIYHPNIDTSGGVCVSVLRPWKPTYSVQIVLFGILFLFSDPNPDDPLNKAAAEVMRNNKTTFVNNVKASMSGRAINGEPFPKNRGLLKK